MRDWVKRTLLAAVGGLWILAAGLGYRQLVRYENAPGEASAPPVQWPAASAIHRDPSRATLVMVVHPQCSCTRASIAELSRMMAHRQGLVDAHVLFFRPRELPKDWAPTDLWSTAAAIPGVQVHIDDEGEEAKIFDATTSGSVMLYGRDSRLQFSGGITPSRSHSGDNAGSDAIVALLANGRAERRSTFVFGCSLLDGRKP
jgi:hypothetical protein